MGGDSVLSEDETLSFGTVEAHSHPLDAQLNSQDPSGVECTSAPVASVASRNLIVNYLPVEVVEPEFQQLFEQFGPVERVKIVRDRKTRYPKGYGFVKFVDGRDAAAAMNSLDGFEMYGKRLRIRDAEIRPKAHSLGDHNIAGLRLYAPPSAAMHRAPVPSSDIMPDATAMPVEIVPTSDAPPLLSGLAFAQIIEHSSVLTHGGESSVGPHTASPQPGSSISWATANTTAPACLVQLPNSASKLPSSVSYSFVNPAGAMAFQPPLQGVSLGLQPIVE